MIHFAPILTCALIIISAGSSGQQARTIALHNLQDGKNCEVFNRSMEHLSDGPRRGLSLDERAEDGLVWIEGTFSEGSIELDIRGKNKPGQSFVGIAFHGADNSAFDAVYFRPFNFQAQDPIRRSHSVQYISMPRYDWSALREGFPGKYENELTESVEANSWFHARIEVHGKTVTVFINKSTTPCLSVETLDSRASGRVGLWVGNGSGGDFSNLVITE